jgi:NAD+ synthase
MKQYIVNWIKDYFKCNGPEAKAVIGISGGKDSTIAAALCVEALGRDRVIGVLMPQGDQSDIADSYRVCRILGIENYEINIDQACFHICAGLLKNNLDALNPQVQTNLPARIRMATLYAVAAAVGGRVCNTSNMSEIYVGYSTKWGDNVGDFGPLRNLTKTEVVRLGHELGLPADLIDKAPADGMSGLTDEDNLGFAYEDVDRVITMEGDKTDLPNAQKIIARNRMSWHKNIFIPAPTRLTDIPFD